MYGQRVKQQSNEEYRATMVGKKKEHGKKERGNTSQKKTNKNAKNKVRTELRPLYNPLDLGLSTSNPKLVSFLTFYLFSPSH